jgi:hypothetical protein
MGYHLRNHLNARDMRESVCVYVSGEVFNHYTCSNYEQEFRKLMQIRVV